MAGPGERRAGRGRTASGAARNRKRLRPRPRWPNRHAARGHRGGMPKPSTRTAAPTWRVAIRTSCSNWASASGRRGETPMRPGAFRTTCGGLRADPTTGALKSISKSCRARQAAPRPRLTATATRSSSRPQPAPPLPPQAATPTPRAEPAAVPAAPAAATPNATSSPPAVDLTAAAAPAAAGPPLHRWVPWSLAATTVVLAGVAVWAGLSANDRFDELQHSCGQTSQGCDAATTGDLKDRARRANILWALTGVAAVGTGVTIYVNTSAAGVSGLWRY